MADIIRETDEYVRYDIDFDEIVDAAQQVEEAAEGYDDLNGRFTAMDDRIDQAQQAIHFKGFVNYYSDLPNSPMENDAYTVLYSGTSGTDPDGTEYIWSNRGGTYEWNPWGKSTYTQSQIDDKLAHIKANQVDGMTGYVAPTNPTTWQTIAAGNTLNEAVQYLDNNSQINKNNISLILSSQGLLFDTTTIIGTDWTLTTIVLDAPTNAIVDMTVTLIYGEKAPRGIYINRSNVSATGGIAKIEDSSNVVQLRLSATGVKLNGVNKYYVWVKSANTGTSPIYLMYKIYE